MIQLFDTVNALEIVDGALVAGSVTINGITATEGEQDIWSVDGNQATLTHTNNGGVKLSADGKTITFEGGTDDPEQLFVISSLKENLTVDELEANVSIGGATVTVNENVLGTDEVTISEGYKLALARTVPLSGEIPANWDINGTTATFTSEHVTEGYAVVESKIIHRAATEAATFTITGIKENLTADELSDGVTIDGSTVTLNENILNQANVTISEGWTLALSDDVPQSETTAANWDINSAGATRRRRFTLLAARRRAIRSTTAKSFTPTRQAARSL